MEKAKESVVVSWCDTGSTDSLFTSSLSSILLHINQLKDVSAVGLNQTIGNQIARQRQDALRNFEDMGCDWMLWVDSDIVITPQVFDLLWQNRNTETHPVMCGVYFISYEMNETLPAPLPCIFNYVDETGSKPVHPLPKNQIIPIDVAGLGLTLMHKSVAKKLREAYGETTFQIQIDAKHISEDVSFFYKLKELGIPVYAHTGAIANHIKRFSFDQNYYNLWWNHVAPVKMKEADQLRKAMKMKDSEGYKVSKSKKKPAVKKVSAKKKDIKKIEKAKASIKK